MSTAVYANGNTDCSALRGASWPPPACSRYCSAVHFDYALSLIGNTAQNDPPKSLLCGRRCTTDTVRVHMCMFLTLTRRTDLRCPCCLNMTINNSYLADTLVMSDERFSNANDDNYTPQTHNSPDTYDILITSLTPTIPRPVCILAMHVRTYVVCLCACLYRWMSVCMCVSMYMCVCE